MKMNKVFFRTILCVAFTGTLAVSAVAKSNPLLDEDEQSVFTLQNENQAEPQKREFEREIFDVDYVKNDGTIDARPVAFYRPKGAEGDLPLVFVPHYPLDEKSGDFQMCLNNGWACAAPYDFQNEYNGVLGTDNLVFNNAALHALRHKEGVDAERIIISGGSAGGYTALMLGELQMGAAGVVANSPVTNLYFNFHIHFLKCDEINRGFDIPERPILIQGMISALFRPNNDCFSGDDDPKWEALSPISMARAISSPTVINHFTGDILVPIDQVTKKYTYDEHEDDLPQDFTARMGDDYPGNLSRSFEEMCDPNELSLSVYRAEGKPFLIDMPYAADKLVSINVYDDGKTGAKASHTARVALGGYRSEPFLQEIMAKSLKETERLVPEKILLMLERYCGESKQLPAHVEVDDAIYGSLTLYRQEIVEELARYAANHSLKELDEFVQTAIVGSENETKYAEAWETIKSQIQLVNKQ